MINNKVHAMKTNINDIFSSKDIYNFDIEISEESISIYKQIIKEFKLVYLENDSNTKAHLKIEIIDDKVLFKILDFSPTELFQLGYLIASYFPNKKIMINNSN